jgi:hypothetical protein
MMGAHLRSIEVVDYGEYVVTLMAPDGRGRDYVFVVGDTVIPVVVWPPEFAQALEHNMVKARAVYEAVMAVHKACTSVIDIDLSTDLRPEK